MKLKGIVQKGAFSHLTSKAHMKKIIFFVLLAVMLTGCGGDGSSSNNPDVAKVIVSVWFKKVYLLILMLLFIQ